MVDMVKDANANEMGSNRCWDEVGGRGPTKRRNEVRGKDGGRLTN